MESREVQELIYGGSFRPGVLIACGVVLAAVVAWIAWRESRVAGLPRVALLAVPRCLVVLAVLWMLAEPTIRTSMEQVRGKAIAFLADTSASMSVSDAGTSASTPRSRMDEALEILEEAESSWLRPIEAQARILRYEFQAAPQSVPGVDWRGAANRRTPEGGMSTDLAAALEQTLRDRAGEDLKAVVLLSDGGHNTPADPVRTAAALTGVPVFVLPMGDSKPVRDVLVHHVQSPRTVLQNDQIVIDAMVDAHGCEGEELLVELRQHDRVLGQERVAVPSDIYARRVSFTQKAAEMGMQEFVLQVQAVPDELTAENNHVAANVEVTQGKITLLLADAQPRWEYRYLRNLLRRDQQTELHEVLVSSAGAISALPATLDEWDRHRVVVLGDLGVRDLDAVRQRQLVDYVGRRGGSLILIAGERMPGEYEDQPLAELVPVTKQGAAGSASAELFVTPEGASLGVAQLADDVLVSNRLWREQFAAPAALLNVGPYTLPKPTTRVLIQILSRVSQAAGGQDARAFLCWKRFGRGRVIYLAGPITYMLRQHHGDTYHHRLWGQMLRWAMARELPSGSATVQLTTDKARYSAGEEVQVSVRLRLPNGEPVASSDERVIAHRQQEKVAEARLTPDVESPGLHRAVLSGLPTGSVELEVAGSRSRQLLEEEGIPNPVTLGIVTEPAESLEMRSTRCNMPLLTRIAETTGGAVSTREGLKDLLSALDLSPNVSRTVTNRPLWNRWRYLWLIVACLSFEWAMRKYMGLA